ncbi:MAG: SH3 domain-containing protein [Chloroflexota bacterium]
MKFHYKFLLFILFLLLPALACGGDATTSTNTDRSNSVEIPTATPQRRSSTRTSAATSTPKPPSPIITITGTRVNIRSGPGTDYAVIQTLDKDDTAPAVGFNSEQTWVQIELPDNTLGWVSADLVDIDNSDQIIVTDALPAPVATTSSSQPSSSDNNQGSSGGNTGGDTGSNTSGNTAGNTGGDTGSNTGGNNGNAFQCVGGCATAPDPSCAIKGNVNSSGEKIYHVPGGSFYNRTDIKPEEGDRWFCTSAEAQAAGFRASSR